MILLSIEIHNSSRFDERDVDISTRNLHDHGVPGEVCRDSIVFALCFVQVNEIGDIVARVEDCELRSS